MMMMMTTADNQYCHLGLNELWLGNLGSSPKVTSLAHPPVCSSPRTLDHKMNRSFFFPPSNPTSWYIELQTVAIQGFWALFVDKWKPTIKPGCTTQQLTKYWLMLPVI